LDTWQSQAGFYSDLCACLVLCDPLGITSSVDLKRDVEILQSRASSEGLQFLTKTLPLLGKALDRALEVGRLVVPRGFHLDRSRNRPAFLQAYFSLLFDEDGAILEEAPADAVRHIRQVCFFAYKLDIPFSQEQRNIVIDNFVAVEEELKLTHFDDADPVLDLASRICGTIFEDFDPSDIVPRHGPGAVATGERLDEKWDFSHKYSNLHRVFPIYEFFMVGKGRELQDRLGWYRRLELRTFGSAKVVLVPKDSRGPRLISEEPLEFQWIQQGLGRKFMRHLEDNRLTSGNINFTNQGVNQQLALANSISREFATLDLRDASDRVSLALVRRIFKEIPRTLDHLEACRSSATTLPDGRVIELSKFAPMGSALCFPIEAFCFWVLMVADLVVSTRLPLKRVGRSIFVYGDDIIVPVDWADRCMNALERYGLRVNRDKSFITGFFRESCGVDAFKGVDVSPSRLRTQWTGRYTDGSAYASYIALMNQLFIKDYFLAYRYLLERIEETYGKVPFGLSTSSFPCRIVSNALEAEIRNSRDFFRRWNPKIQLFEFKVLSLFSKRQKTQLDGWPRLLRNLVMPQLGDPSVVVVPRSTKIKRVWAVV